MSLCRFCYIDKLPQTSANPPASASQMLDCSWHDHSSGGGPLDFEFINTKGHGFSVFTHSGVVYTTRETQIRRILPILLSPSLNAEFSV